MKTFAKIAIASILALSSVHAKSKTLPPVSEIVQAFEVTPEIIEQLLNKTCNDVAIELAEGTSIPIKFLCNYNLLSVKWDPSLSVEITKTIYLRQVGNKFYVSVDLVNWDKASSLLDGKVVPNIRIAPDKSHIVIETNLVPYSDDDSDSSSSCSSDSDSSWWSELDDTEEE